MRSKLPIILLLNAAILFAQNPANLSLTLATKGGQRQFRIGEVIPLELQFDSTTPGRYEVHNPSERSSQRFSSQPSVGVVDPFADFPPFGSAGMGSAVPRPMTLGGQPAVIQRELNSWLAFRKPGRYRITADVTAVTPAGVGLSPKADSFIPLHSNALEIEIIDDPAWSKAQLQANVATIEAHVPRQVGGRGFSSDFDGERAAQQLSLLDTRESALAMVSIYGRNLDYQLRTHLDVGLRRSPYRKDVIEAMGKTVEAPDTPITEAFLGTFDDIVAITNSKPADYAKAYEFVYQKLAQAFNAKKGNARIISLESLAHYQGLSPPPEIAETVFKNIAELPAAYQIGILTDRWLYMGIPEILPYLRTWSAGTGSVRDAALNRLLDVRPAEAREIILSRIRNKEWQTDPTDLLLSLEDGLHPEFDTAFADALERGLPVQALISRYGSDRIFDRVRSNYETKQLPPCSDLLTYFFRVNEAYAIEQLSRGRTTNASACPLKMSGLLMSSGLEAAAIRDLDSREAVVRDAALALLRDFGSENAKQALFNHLDQPAMLRALPVGRGWLLTPPELDRIAKACSDDACLSWIRGQITATYYQPIQIAFLNIPTFQFRIGATTGMTFGQLENKIRQYPQGTSFAFARPFGSTGWQTQGNRERVQRVIEGAGMKLAPQ